MSNLNTQNVIDQMVSQLAERRQTAVGRRAAYLNLARAILVDQLSDDFTAESRWQSEAIARAPRAA